VTHFAPDHQFLRFMSPLSQQRADRLVAFLADGLEGDVLDVGCGWAELLLQVVAAAPGGRGVGVDLNETALRHGRVLAQARGLADRVTLLAQDAKETECTPDAVICIGASQIWGPPVEEHQPLGYASALTALRGLLPRGGRLVYGEGVWSAPPTREAAAPLAGRLDEFVPLAELVDLAVASGFQPVHVSEASTDEWDEFETGFTAPLALWLSENPDHPDADDVRARAAAQRAGYFKGYRNVLGMAYLGLVAV
jgi:SAM-dependent methyltransferase